MAHAFERDTLIDELLAWSFDDIHDSYQIKLLETLRESRLNMLSGEKDSIRDGNANLIEFMAATALLIGEMEAGEIQPHIVPKIRRFLQLVVRTSVVHLSADIQLSTYEQRLLRLKLT